MATFRHNFVRKTPTIDHFSLHVRNKSQKKVFEASNLHSFLYLAREQKGLATPVL